MRILMVIPELAPFYKYSRLGLGSNLHNLIFNLHTPASIIMPFYEQMRKIKCRKLEEYEDINLSLYHGTFPGTDKEVFFLKPNDRFFDPFYGADVDIEQVMAFSRGVARFVEDHSFDILHAHHWQNGLIPLLVKSRNLDVRTVYTFYDLEQQGLIEPTDLETFDIAERYRDEIESLGNLSLVKLGLVFADAVTTTSRQYAKDVQQSEFGHDLEPYFLRIAGKLYGINNGVRYGEWNPAKDANPDIRFHDLPGKHSLKTNLQREHGLKEDARIPLILYGGRLTAENGCEIVLDALPVLCSMHLQLIVYGTGESESQIRLREFADRCKNLSVHIGYDQVEEHRLIAASDMILLPAREAPGTTMHLRAMRYGTIPIARRTGSFVDAIREATSGDMQNANGFLFSSYYSNSLIQIMEEALDVYRENELWEMYFKNAMQEDWSWKYSARQYEELYKKILSYSG